MGMNQKRPHSKDDSERHLDNSNKARQKYQVSLNQLLEANQNTEQSSDFSQSTPLHQPLWFWRQHSCWSCLNRGLFWGAIIIFTSVSSAIAGIALTKIDAVERFIVQKISPSPLNSTSVKQTVLTRPMNILLVEVQSDAEEKIGLSDTFVEESKIILLLKIKPQQDSAQIINIPINSKTEIPGFGQGTINDAYKIGGTKLLSETVNQLTKDSRVYHYISATSETFRKLTASGKINLEDCDSTITNCSNKLEQIIRQQTTFKTIRQRLNIPGYLANFQAIIAQDELDLDTNISVPEIISLANFIKELEPESMRVDLLPGYTPGKDKTPSNKIAKSSPIKPEKKTAKISPLSITQSNPWQYSPIAVQNTTNNPELGKQVVAYLRHRNFRDVYLVENMPLKLKQTRIFAHHSQGETANYLQNILGFGYLERKPDASNRELTLQIGEDALYLPTNYRLYH